MKRAITCAFLMTFVVQAGDNATIHPARAQEEKKLNAAEEDLRKLQGVWHHVSRHEKGKLVAEEDKDALIAFRENVLVVKRGMTVIQVGLIKNINPKADPKEFDIISTDGPNEGSTIKAIYEIKDDTFRFCGGLKSRPRTFTTSPDDKDYIQCSSYRKVK